MSSMMDEKEYTISSCDQFWKSNEETPAAAPSDVRHDAFDCDNLLTELTGASKINTPYQLSHTLYEVGGQCRRDR